MNQEIKFLYLKSQPLFMHLPDKELTDMVSLTRIKTLDRAEVVDYGDGDFTRIYFIAKGKIKITEANEFDEELIKDVLREGDVFGDLGLEGNVSGELAQALTSNTVVGYFHISDFKHILHANPALTLQYAGKVSRKLKKLEGRHADLVFRDTKARLMRFMKNWALTDGDKLGDKIVLSNYLTHGEIAGIIATSRQSVNVLFNELRNSGLIYYNRKTIELNMNAVWN